MRPADELASCSAVSELKHLTIEAVSRPMAASATLGKEFLERNFILID